MKPTPLERMENLLDPKTGRIPGLTDALRELVKQVRYDFDELQRPWWKRLLKIQ